MSVWDMAFLFGMIGCLVQEHRKILGNNSGEAITLHYSSTYPHTCTQSKDYVLQKKPYLPKPKLSTLNNQSDRCQVLPPITSHWLTTLIMPGIIREFYQIIRIEAQIPLL